MKYFRIFILSLLIMISCSSSLKKFTRFEKPEMDSGMLYLIRNYNPILSFFAFEIQIYQFEGDFKNRIKKLIYDFELETGEYVNINLEPGFYEIYFPDFKDYSHIFFIQDKEIKFKSIQIISESFFSFSTVVIQDITQEKAAEFLLEFQGMNQRLIDKR